MAEFVIQQDSINQYFECKQLFMLLVEIISRLRTIRCLNSKNIKMRELVILPDGTSIYRIMSDYSFDEQSGRYKSRITHKGVDYTVFFYANFWACQS